MNERDRVQSALRAIEDYPVFVAYNANVDAIVDVDERLEAALDPPTGDDPTQLDTPQALSTALARAMRTGEGDEMRTTDAFADWLVTHLDADEEQLGGQAGIGADVLSVLGAAPVLYTYLLSARQRASFQRPSAIRYPLVDDGAIRYVPVSEVTTSDRTKVNWIFEFAAGTQFYGVVAETDSRFIAAERPEAFDLDTGALERVPEQLGATVECALLSGYQAVKAQYDDGRSFRDCLDGGAQFVRRLRADNDVTVQIEYGVTHLDALRQGIVDHIVPHADAIGVDTHDLRLLASDLGVPTDGREATIVGRYELARDVRDALGVACLKLHATDYFLAVTDDYLSPAAVAHGFDVASVVGATKAARGRVTGPDALAAGMARDRAPAGVRAVETLAGHLGVAASDGIVETADAVALAHRVVDDPVGTVGLGDTVSACSFVVENALARADATRPNGG